MEETPMLFPIAPSEFWKQIRAIIEDVITEKLSLQKISPPNNHLPEKTLLKPIRCLLNFPGMQTNTL